MRCAIVVLAALAVGGCGSPGMNRSMYESKIQDVKIGMSKSDFKTMFPSAKPRGAKQCKNGVIEVLEVGVSHYSYMPSGEHTERNGWTGMESRPQWFYFYNEKLMQYGKPNDWPNEPDQVVEVQVK